MNKEVETVKDIEVVQNDVVVVENSKENESEYIVDLAKVYNFEGEQISHIDLSGLNNLTGNDMIKANKVLAASGVSTVSPETNLEYCLVLASAATGKPIEFFKGLRLRDTVKVKTAVINFLFGEE